MTHTVTFLWPPATLSGHAKGGHWGKIADTKQHREWARLATLAARIPPMPAEGDIPIRITFQPPNRRGDRVNFPARIKPILDGIADALGVNDARFLPEYVFADPVKGGKVIVEVMP